MLSKDLEIMSKLYKIRSTVISVLGKDKFKTKVDEFRPAFLRFCKTIEFTELLAAVEIMLLLTTMNNDSFTAEIAACCVEIMEPSID